VECRAYGARRCFGERSWRLHVPSEHRLILVSDTASVARPGIKWKPYASLDIKWKHLVETGPKWFMENVWKGCLHYVRVSNAWPYESDPDAVTFHPRRPYPDEEDDEPTRRDRW
jgi:hypothetical protein